MRAGCLSHWTWRLRSSLGISGGVAAASGRTAYRGTAVLRRARGQRAHLGPGVRACAWHWLLASLPMAVHLSPNAAPVQRTETMAKKVLAQATFPNGEVWLRVRKHRRRPNLLLAERAWVAAPFFDASPSAPAGAADAPSPPPRWLETHIWHAKRAAMEGMWGFRLAARNSFLGVRALHRASARHACMHDMSYLEAFELSGGQGPIAEVLERCGVARQLSLAAPARAGARRVRALLHEAAFHAGDSSMSLEIGALISPVLFIWQPEADIDAPSVYTAKASEGSEEEMPSFFTDVRGTRGAGTEIVADVPTATASSTAAGGIAEAGSVVSSANTRDQLGVGALRRRRLVLWVHPAAAGAAMASLERAVAVVAAPAGPVSVPRLRRLEGTAFLELTGPRALEILARAVPPSACASGAVAAEIWHSIAAESAGTRLALPSGAVLALDVDRDDLAASATQATSAGAAGTSVSGGAPAHQWQLRWPAAAAEGNGRSFWSTFASAGGAVERGSSAGADEAEGPPSSGGHGRVPILFIFRGGAGVDVIVPPRSGAAQIWLRCAFAGARFAGFRDRHALHTAAGRPEFPFDYPEAAAGEEEARVAAGRGLERYLRRPPGKRPNFAALGTPCPHRADWCRVEASAGARPIVLRPPALGPCSSAPLRDASFLAVVVRCPGRGVPRALCHLYLPEPGDFPAIAPTPPATRGSTQRSGGRHPIGVRNLDLPEPPVWPRDSRAHLEEPLHKWLKRRRLRQREQRTTARRESPVATPTRPAAASAELESKQAEVNDGEHATNGAECKTRRKLVGFVTSGGRSDLHGCGLGVGAVSARAFAMLLETLGAVGSPSADAGAHCAGLADRWILLWARNTSSLVYFPVWAQALRRDEGFG